MATCECYEEVVQKFIAKLYNIVYERIKAESNIFFK